METNTPHIPLGTDIVTCREESTQRDEIEQNRTAQPGLTTDRRLVICYPHDTVIDIAPESLIEEILISARTISSDLLHGTRQFIATRVNLVRCTWNDMITMSSGLFDDLFSDRMMLRESLVASSLLLYAVFIFSGILCVLDSGLNDISFFEFPLAVASIPMFIAFVI